MTHGDLVGLEVVTILGQLALLPRGQKRPLAAAVHLEVCRVGELDASGLHILGPSRVVAAGAVLDGIGPGRVRWEG